MILVPVNTTGRTGLESWVTWLARWQAALAHVDSSWSAGVGFVLAWLSFVSRGGRLEANFNPVQVPCTSSSYRCFEHPIVNDLLVAYDTAEDAIRAYQAMVRSNDEAWRRLQARDWSWVYFALPFTSPLSRPTRDAVVQLYRREIVWTAGILGLPEV